MGRNVLVLAAAGTGLAWTQSWKLKAASGAPAQTVPTVRCWFVPPIMQGGKRVQEPIDEAIPVHDKLLLMLSDASMSSSWVETEVANARAREEQQKRQMLCPITVIPFERIRDWKLFDADRGIDSGREIRKYFIPDFSNWKARDGYQRAFERLLRDSKDESKAKDQEAGR